jgi:hypothetical protein
MSNSFEEHPTQQVRRPEPPAAPLPGSLDPLRGHETAETADAPTADAPEVEPPAPTGVLPLGELFDDAPPAAPIATPPAAPAAPTAAEEAPTWTAMPVVPVRSEPMPMAGRPVPGTYHHTAATGTGDPAYGRAPRADHIGDALSATTRAVGDWLRREDNGLMLLTAIVACILILVVAAVGS